MIPAVNHGEIIDVTINTLYDTVRKGQGNQSKRKSLCIVR